MKAREPKKLDPNAVKARRKAIGARNPRLVEEGTVSPSPFSPILLKPAVTGLDPFQWIGRHDRLVESRLCSRGGVLLRSFGLRGEEDLERFIRAGWREPIEYTYRSTPRTELKGRIYTSTEYPADQSIPLHNEMSYAREWPQRIFFLCVQPAAGGGETPVADSRRVLERISPGVRDRFVERGVMYVRNYGPDLDLPWQEVFQTTDRAAVERFCAGAGIELEWLGGDRARTRQVCQAITRHPETGEAVWFNQAHLFHASSLERDVYESLAATLPEEEFPRHCYYGDGTPIAESALDEIRGAFRQEEVVFEWQRGDLLVLDNVLMAHGRRPYRGARKIVVGMADPTRAAGNAGPEGLSGS